MTGDTQDKTAVCVCEPAKGRRGVQRVARARQRPNAERKRGVQCVWERGMMV